MKDTKSPLAVMHTLVEDLRLERRTPATFVKSLDTLDRFLETWAKDLEILHFSEQYPQGRFMFDHAIEGLAALAEASAILRKYAATRDEATAAQAMLLATQGQTDLIDLFRMTEQNL